MTRKVFYPLPEIPPLGRHVFQSQKPVLVCSQLGERLSLESQLQ